MSIIKKGFTLNFYNNRTMNAQFDCSKGPDKCEKMLKKLVFFDRDQLLDAHTEEVLHSKPLDISQIETVKVLDKNEQFDRVVPLDRDCLGVFIKDKTTGEYVNKALYILFEGEGYLTDDVEPAKNGFVPDYVYYQNARDTLYLYRELDEKYFDGNHEKFLENIIKIMEERIASMIFSPIFAVDNISYEDGFSLVKRGYAERKTNPELYEKAKNADFLAYEFGASIIAEFYENREKRNKQVNSAQPVEE